MRKLVDTALNPHFTSLQFIGSAGSWSPDSRQFVVGGVHAGKAVLAILDIANGDVAREIEMPRGRRDSQPDLVARRQVDRVLGNGRRRFRPVHLRSRPQASAKRDHERSLCRPAAGVVARRRHASRSSPIDSPPNADAAATPGDYRLALLDVASGRISPLSTFAQGKNINPQWTSRQPAPVLRVRSERHQQYLSVDTAVRRAGADYERRQRHQRHHRAEPGDLVGDRCAERWRSAPTRKAAITSTSSTRRSSSPARRSSRRSRGYRRRRCRRSQRESIVARILSDPIYRPAGPNRRGRAVQVRPVARRGRASRTSRPASIGSAAWSAAASRSASATCSATTICTRRSAPTPTAAARPTSRRTPARVVAYTNIVEAAGTGASPSNSRPYIAGGYAIGQGVVNGETALLDQTIIQRQINRGVSGMVAYPFSQTARIEFGGGFTRTSFDQQIRTIADLAAHRPRDLGRSTETTSISPTR